MPSKGLRQKMMAALMDAARSKGLKIMQGEVLANNDSMLKLMARLGFSASTSAEDASIKLVSKVL
jgi:acetyltransferase